MECDEQEMYVDGLTGICTVGMITVSLLILSVIRQHAIATLKRCQ